MALFDKLSDIAKNVGDKAGDAVEISKLTAKSLNEKTEVHDLMKKIGEFYYKKFEETGVAEAEVQELFDAAKKRYETIASLQAEINRIKAEGKAPAAAPAEEAPAEEAPQEACCCDAPKEETQE